MLGAYVFGRTASRVRVEAGRKVVKAGIPRRQEEWSVLIRDHHAGYITWDQYERNQRLIRQQFVDFRRERRRHRIVSNASDRPDPLSHSDR